jgi:hypothetical protein
MIKILIRFFRKILADANQAILGIISINVINAIRIAKIAVEIVKIAPTV